MVSLTATPSQNSDFIGWTGAYTGPNNPCTVTMAEVKSITAQFDLKALPILSVNPTNRNVASTAGNITFNVSNTGTGIMNWTASVSSGGSWLSISSGTSGTDSRSITCSFDENTGESNRTATIRVIAAGATNSPADVTVAQTGAGTATLTGLSIIGPDMVEENGKAEFKAMASWSDGTTSRVTPSWSEDSDYASIDADGLVTTIEITRKQSVSLFAFMIPDGGGMVVANLTFSIVKIANMTNCADQAGTIQRGCEHPQDVCKPFDFENTDDYLNGDFLNPNRGIYELCECLSNGSWTTLNEGDIIDIRMNILVDDGSGKISGDNGIYWAEDVNGAGISADQYFDQSDACSSEDPFSVNFAGEFDYLTADNEVGVPLSGVDTLCDGLSENNRVVTIQPKADQISDHGYVVDMFDVFLGIFICSWDIDIPKMRVDSNSISGGEKVWVRICFERNSEPCCQDIYIGQLCDKSTMPPELSLTPLTLNVDENSGSTTFDVANAGWGTMDWNASVVSGNSWLTITAGSSGTNTGTITCNFSANPDSTRRTGTIRITSPGATNSPIDVTIVQAGKPVTLTALHIIGPKVLNRKSAAVYKAVADWSNGS
ncbi:BACON domain-containing protein, partial [bacterium]|nr:BACON domain-containing protein [bacterium]